MLFLTTGRSCWEWVVAPTPVSQIGPTQVLSCIQHHSLRPVLTRPRIENADPEPERRSRPWGCLLAVRHRRRNQKSVQAHLPGDSEAMSSETSQAAPAFGPQYPPLGLPKPHPGTGGLVAQSTSFGLLICWASDLPTLGQVIYLL